MKFLFTLFLLSLASTNAISGEVCETLNTPNDVLKCVVNHHLSIRMGKSELSETELGIEVAKQRPNPDLDVDVTDTSGSGFGTEVSYLHTFELGNKREARIKVAESIRNYTRSDLINRQENLAIRTVTSMYRLRQINHELSVVTEIISTFKKIIGQYRNVGRLGPEQQISISVFTMALEENKLAKNSLLNEREVIVGRIETGIGKKIDFTDKILPELKSDWPKFESKDNLKSSKLQLALHEIDLAKANVEIEKSESTPNLAIGPKFGFERDERNSFSIGIGVSVPLPLYQNNSAGRAKAMASLNNSQLKFNFTKTELESEKQILIDLYNRIVGGISKTLSEKQIEHNHRNLHTMIKRGVVSASIVIELHRQIIDYYSKLHEQEILAVQAYWKILAIEGRILAEELR